jgi:hypothetical protein
MKYIIIIAVLIIASCSQKEEQPETKRKIQPVLTDDDGNVIEIKKIDILTIEKHQYIRYYEETEFFTNTNKTYKMQFPVIIHRPDCIHCKPKKSKK